MPRLLLLLLLLSLGLHAAEPAVKKSTWQGYDRLDFTVDGRDCLLVLPKTAAPGKPWIWRTEFFGHEPQADVALLGHGFHVAYMNVQNMYGAPVALDHMDRFYEHLTKEYGLSPKPVLEGFSRGGLFAFNWAARNPTHVGAIYADAPVCDFRTWPHGDASTKGSNGDWERLKQVYGFANDEAAMAYKLNPVDNLAPLAAAKIPLLHVCGDADKTVPVKENTLLVQERYQKLGGEIKVILKPGGDHHPHSLKDPAPIVDWVLAHLPGNP
jgi:pimeloyl-ACP methyl ester carboxylesterase